MIFFNLSIKNEEQHFFAVKLGFEKNSKGPRRVKWTS